MRRLIGLLTALLLFASCTAVCAEGGSGIPAVGQIVEMSPGSVMDLDGDGDQETVEYEILRDEDGYDIGYRLRVDDAAVEGEGWAMNESVCVLRLDKYNTLLLVSDYGPSDDYETLFYLYIDDKLIPVGSILSLPEFMKVNDGIITAPVRGYLLYTWSHDADFALADYWGEDGETKACIYQIPRYLYPMGLMVKLKTDLPVAVSMTNPEIAHTFRSGSEVILCATDDVEWVYIQSVEDGTAGWMKAGGEYGMECVVGDEMMSSWEVFDGLLFAD